MRIFVGKTLENWNLEYREGDERISLICMLRETGCEGEMWMKLAQGRVHVR